MPRLFFGATYIHLPVSTTHVISSGILGVGSAHRIKGVKWDTAQTYACYMGNYPSDYCISSVNHLFHSQFNLLKVKCLRANVL